MSQYLSFIRNSDIVCICVSICTSGYVQAIEGETIDPTPVEDYCNEFPAFVTECPIDLDTYTAMLEKLDEAVTPFKWY
jgi:uncharacterized protein YsxB (DUF464 family)